MKAKTFFIGCWIIIAIEIIVIVYQRNAMSLDNQEIEITVGEEYLFSFDWEEENPFELKIDTAKVLEVKGEYVKWTFRGWPEDFFQTSETKYFKHLIRKL